MMKPKQSDSWFVRKLIALGACDEAIKYARKYRTFPAAWRECKSTRWLKWLIQTVNLVPEHVFTSNGECVGCKWGRTLAGREWYALDDTNSVRRRFPADRVAKKLRQVK